MLHELKILPEYFGKKLEGFKSWEHRVNDRNFKPGDWLLLREWKDGSYTGRHMHVHVLWIHDLNDGTVILSDNSGSMFLPGITQLLPQTMESVSALLPFSFGQSSGSTSQ